MTQDVNDSAALLERIEELEARIDRMSHGPRPEHTPAGEQPTEDTTTSRRGLLKLAGAAAAGAAASSLLAAAPAAASDGNSLLIGGTNVGEVQTWLGYDGSSALGNWNLFTVYDAPFPASDFSASIYPAALGGWADGGPAAIPNGIYGYTAVANGYAVIGYGANNATSHGVLANSSDGYGLVATGGRAPIVLLPAGTAGPPTAGLHQLGEIYVDSGGILYRCVTAGTPGTWARLNSVVTLASPVRVIDTRSAVGGITGPLSANTTATSTAITGGSSGIPAQAVAVVGTVTMVAATDPGSLPGTGYLTVFPGGGSLPVTSNVNADTGHAIASGLTVALGTGGNAGKVSFNASFACHALLDVAAYVI